MRKTRFLSVLIFLLCVVTTTLVAQGSKANKGFLLDVNRPFVYVKFDHIGSGAPRSVDEPNFTNMASTYEQLPDSHPRPRQRCA